MNNNSSGHAITTGNNYNNDNSSDSKFTDIKHTQQVVTSTTFTSGGGGASQLADNQPKAKIRPHRQGETAVRRDSSSSGSSGPPENNDVSSQNFDAARAADFFLGSRIDRQSHATPQQTQQQQSEDIDTRQFCLGYREVVKFIDQLGMAFAFIAKMMRGRLDYIENLVHSDNREVAERYRTVERMLQYDVAQGVKKSRKVCCSQEMLHLNRSLEFMAAFTEKAFRLNDEDKLSGVAVETYNATVSKHHPFLVRKTIQLALYTLPTKKQMADLLGNMPYDKKVEQVTAMVEQQRAVYRTVDNLYTKYDLQSLA